ncbi:hypothetical protein GCM10007086_27450 [Photobacterium aphoticum]|nr:hypothetical protein GCM10007086_27450 [Photobacterium aphoticum]
MKPVNWWAGWRAIGTCVTWPDELGAMNSRSCTRGDDFGDINYCAKACDGMIDSGFVKNKGR